MAYDSTRERVVLFGGLSSVNGPFLGDTWEWDGSFWTQMDDIGPSPRENHAMVYDSARQVTLLFAGQTLDGLQGDTWQWNGQDWTQVSDSGPSPRFAHAMAFDSGRKVTVLFGGSTGGATLQDTWEFDGQDWTQQDDAGPAARLVHAMAYGISTSRVILFGGNASDNTPLGDTWAWDGAAWVQIAEFGPAPRGGAAMTWMGDGTVLFGGLGAHQTIFADTWEFDGKLWTQRQDIGPAARSSHAMAFDTTRSTVVIFGGLNPLANPLVTLGDTWEHPEHPEHPPAPVSVSLLQLAPVDGRPGDQINATITLSGPAPVGGVVVQMSFRGGGQTVPLPNVVGPAGATTIQSQFIVPQVVTLPGPNATVSAEIAGTPAVIAIFSFN
jgi:hypothetical protein